MERAKYLLLTLLFSLLTQNIAAQDSKKHFDAFLSGDMQEWKQEIDKKISAGSLSLPEEMDLLRYEYGYIGFLLGTKNKSDASKYLKGALKRLEKLRKSSDQSELEAFASAFIGYQIGISPLKAPFIGPESMGFAEKAIQLDPAAPWGYIQMGNIKNYAPSVFGGSKKEALEYYLKAKNNFKNVKTYKTNWQYVSLLTSLAQLYESTGNEPAALNMYQEILKEYPEYKWVKEKLLPELKRKMK
ncbi:MAG: tetratricopeptide repeat protein [Bacteroidales bacterium]